MFSDIAHYSIMLSLDAFSAHMAFVLTPPFPLFCSCLIFLQIFIIQSSLLPAVWTSNSVYLKHAAAVCTAKVLHLILCFYCGTSIELFLFSFPRKLLHFCANRFVFWTYLFNTHTCTHTCAALPSPLSTEGSRSERSAKIACDVKFWRIKDVSPNNIFPACIERRVNFSYTWRSSWKTESSSLLKDNAIPVTPHLNDWYIKHAESSGRTLGKERSKTKTTHPKTKKEKYVACYSTVQCSCLVPQTSLSRNKQNSLQYRQ